MIFYVRTTKVYASSYSSRGAIEKKVSDVEVVDTHCPQLLTSSLSMHGVCLVFRGDYQ